MIRLIGVGVEVEDFECFMSILSLFDTRKGADWDGLIRVRIEKELSGNLSSISELILWLRKLINV